MPSALRRNSPLAFWFVGIERDSLINLFLCLFMLWLLYRCGHSLYLTTSRAFGSSVIVCHFSSLITSPELGSAVATGEVFQMGRSDS